jgi:hypothetical protein
VGIGHVFVDVFHYPFTDSNKFLKVILLSLGSFLINSWDNGWGLFLASYKKHNPWV